jgi:hypothetical protein
VKVDGPIAAILKRTVHNEHDYYHQVVYPLLDELGFPEAYEDNLARWPQFPIKNPFGDGWLKLDYLSTVGSLPMLIIEGKERRTLFRDGFRQACAYGRNFEPRTGSEIRKMNVPFIMVAAGERAEMFRAVTRGIDVVYEPIRLEGQPAFLEWSDLIREAENYRNLPDVELPPVPTGTAPGIALTQTDLLKVEFAEQFFDDLYSAIFKVAALRRHDDRRLVLFSQIIQVARQGKAALIDRLCRANGLSKKATAEVLEALSWYEEKFAARELEGPAVALAYREFVTSDQTRKGLKLFTGNSQQINLPPHLRRLDTNGRPSRNTGRYFTPTDIIRQMVRLAGITATDRVIDPFCGSGGFLAEAAMAAARNGDAETFVRDRLVGIDEDPFCVEASRTLLGLMFPRWDGPLNVFLHNSLYDRQPTVGQYIEEEEAEAFLQPGMYDVVIGNPPGNKEYSGSSAEYVADLWRKRYGQTTRLWDHVFFVRRAVELAKPEGGRICILVPDGFLANSQFQHLRNEVMAQCELRAIISLPRVFKNNKAKMSLLYMLRTGVWSRERATLAPWTTERGVFLASIPEKVQESDPTVEGAYRVVPANIYGELERLVDLYQETEASSAPSSNGPGLAAFPAIMAALHEPTAVQSDEDEEAPDIESQDDTAATVQIEKSTESARPIVTTGQKTTIDKYAREELIDALSIVLETGTLEREEAIRRAANLLRDRSSLAFVRLKRSGSIWNALKSAMRAGIRSGVLRGTPDTVSCAVSTPGG